MARGKASPSSVEEEGTRQSSLLFFLEEEEEEGKALSPPFPLPSFSREEERALSASPSSLEEEGSLLLTLALLRRGAESLTICFSLLEKKRLPYPLPCSSREEGRALPSALFCLPLLREEEVALPSAFVFRSERRREPCSLPSLFKRRWRSPSPLPSCPTERERASPSSSSSSREKRSELCHLSPERVREPCPPLLPLLERRGVNFAIFLQRG